MDGDVIGLWGRFIASNGHNFLAHQLTDVATGLVWPPRAGTDAQASERLLSVVREQISRQDVRIVRLVLTRLRQRVVMNHWLFCCAPQSSHPGVVACHSKGKTKGKVEAANDDNRNNHDPLSPAGEV